MDHSEFVREWSAGKLSIDVDRSKALALAGSKVLPAKYQYAHIFWSWVWLLSIPAAIAIAILFKWWVGALLLVFVTPVLSRSTKTSAMQFMIDHSLENREFFERAIAEGVINVRPKA